MLSLYLRRSLQRRPLRHFSLFWILMCAFLLPLVVSIYRDSMIYGHYLQTLDFSKGQAIHISGVEPEDVELLRGIDGLTEPYYEDRWIYLNFASEEAWSRYSGTGSQVELSNLIKTRLSQNGRKAAEIDLIFYKYENVYGIQNDPLLLSEWRQMRIVSFVLTLFSGLIIWNAYRSHVAAFSMELAELAALGATRRQIIGMFLLELCILFPFAASGAVGISYAVMRIIYEQYLQQTMNTTHIWRVFHMDPQNTAVLLAFYLLVCLAALGFAILQKDGKNQARKPRRRMSSLSRRWIQETRPPFVQCLLILVPLITAFLILFNQYLGSYANFLEDSQWVKITITNVLSSIRQEEIDFVSGLDGVRSVEIVRKLSDVFYLNAPDGNALYGKLYRYQDYAPGEPYLQNDQFVANLPAEFESTEPFTLHSSQNYKKLASLTLVKRITPESGIPGPVDIYISSALMNELTASAPIRNLYIYTTVEYASSLESTLQSNLPASYLITSSGSDDVAGAALQVGHLWLLSWIFCILMIVAIQIVWVQLSSYVRECAPMLRTIYQIGASRRQLKQLIPIGWTAIPAAMLPFLIAVPYAKLRTWLRVGRIGTFLLSLPLASIYALIAALAVLAFLLPVKYALHKMQKKL